MLTTDNAGALCAPASTEGGRMHVKILSGTVVDGQRCEPGQIVEVTPDTARTLFGALKAEQCEAPPKRGRPKKSKELANK